ncbi:MAG: PASTA domain-containing protein [Bacteroidota bacterium]
MRFFFQFLKSKRFCIHFIISLAVGFIILWLSFKSLNLYTRHGEMVDVPDFFGLKTNEIDTFIADKNLRYMIIDSVFDFKIKGGSVIRQDPEKNSQVKYNRMVYLTISATMPPLVKMPNLVDASMRQAIAMLESCGLTVGKREYKPDPCVNCVLTQLMKGKKIESGTIIPKGSVIDLILGKGESEEKINVPCFIGLSLKKAIEKISESGLSEGAIICSDCKTSNDSAKAIVYKQIPSCSIDNLINYGNAVDIYLTIKTFVPDTTSHEENIK